MCKHMDLIQVCGHCEVQTNNEVTRRVHFKKKEDTLKNSLLNYNAAAICRFVLQELCQSVHLSLFKYQTLLDGSRKANTKMF